MVDIEHPGSDDPSESKFDHVAQAIQDIRELRERHDREKRERRASRFSSDRLARSAKADIPPADIPPDESLPLFLSTPDNQGSQSTDQDAEHQDSLRQDGLHQETPQQDSLNQASRREETLHQDLGRQNLGHQDLGHQDVRYQNDGHQDDWQQAALEADRERMDAVVSPAITKENLKKGVLATSALFALLALFMLEDHRTLIANVSASLAAVLPTMSSSRGGPALAPEKIATTPPAPLAAVAVAPTREAIAALQGQPPEIRQPSAAQDGETLFKQFQAWEAAQNVKAQAARPAR